LNLSFSLQGCCCDQGQLLWARYKCKSSIVSLGNPLANKAVSNDGNPKYNTHLSFRKHYSQRVPYLFLVFSNNKTQKTILSANRSSGERIPIFELWISWHPK
jgi:hypothetical protein